jgi:DNA-binding SARP family transcriptional activator
MPMADMCLATLQLLDGPHAIIAGQRVSIPEGSKRLVAFVALNGRRADRCNAAAVLWPDAEPLRAAGNLRSALWRLRCAGIDILCVDKRSLSLHPNLRVDLEGIADWADRLVTGKPEPTDLEFPPQMLQALDLLPGWYDDWVLQERERLRQMLLHAIEALSRLLLKANRCGEAIEAALTAVGVEPLRESAQAALIEAHLAEGNRCEALRSYALYEELLAQELGVHPSVELKRRLHHSTPANPVLPTNFVTTFGSACPADKRPSG